MTDPPLDRRSIGAVLRDRAAQQPDAPALCWFGADDTVQRLTYGDLYAAAARLAGVLCGQFHPQSRVAVWSPNMAEWVVIQYAVGLAGMILTPFNPALADGELRVLLEQSGAAVIYAAPAYRGSPLAERARLVAGTGSIEVRTMDEAWVTESAAGELSDVDAESPYLLQYTSGTTGRPKGVVLTHLATYNAARFSAERLELCATDTRLVCLPLHHVGGSVCTVLPMLACGGCVALEAGWDVDRVVDLIAASRSTVMGGVPTMLLDLLDHPGVRDGRLASVRIVQAGGSTVAPSLVRRLESALGVHISVAYGQSEAPVTICSRLNDSPEDKATTIGSPLPHREVRITDPLTGEVLGYGAIGELQIRSPLSMTHYWRDPEQTAAALDADGWLHSGDLCSIDVRGQVTFHGRWRDVIIRGGENIYPAEVEDVLIRHPSVGDVAVVGAPSERWGEEPAAFVRPAEGATVVPAELDEWVRGHLAGFKRPRHWYVVDTLPLTASGKVQKFLLRERLEPSSEM